MIKNSKIFSFLIILILLVSFTFAQIDNVEKQIEDAAEGLKGNVTKVRGFTETDKWNFIGAQWKEFLLKNKAVAGVDSFFFCACREMENEIPAQRANRAIFFITYLFNSIKMNFFFESASYVGIKRSP